MVWPRMQVMTMNRRNERLTKAVSCALAVHILAAIAIGFAGWESMKKLPPEVIEITVDAGGGGGGGGGRGAKTGEASSKPKILQDMDDIVEKVENTIQEPQEEKEEQKEKVQEETDSETKQEQTPAEPSDSNSTGNSSSDSSQGAGSGTGSGGGEGSGEGTGVGSGTGSGEGSGSGSGTGDGSGSGSGSGEGSGSGPGEGAGVPVTAPTVLSSAKPSYPPSARNAEVEGVTYVTFSVDAAGNVVGASVAQSSGNGALDSAAVAAAYQWHFSPALDRYGQPSPCHITIPFTFSLHN